VPELCQLCDAPVSGPTSFLAWARSNAVTLKLIVCIACEDQARRSVYADPYTLAAWLGRQESRLRIEEE
jgi:hypothetical protein